MSIDHTPETKQALQILDVLTRDVSPEQRANSYYTINAIQLLGLKVGQGEEAWKELTPLQREDNLSAFLFVTRAPLETVARGVRFFARQRDEIDGEGKPVHSSEEAWDEFSVRYIAPFLSQISAEAMLDAFDAISKLNEHVPIVAVPPKHQKSERPDPNA